MCSPLARTTSGAKGDDLVQTLGISVRQVRATEAPAGTETRDAAPEIVGRIAPQIKISVMIPVEGMETRGMTPVVLVKIAPEGRETQDMSPRSRSESRHKRCLRERPGSVSRGLILGTGG